MFEKIKKYWEDLDVDAVVNKRELVLGVAACTLAGLALGMLCSPNKQVTIGSNNSQVVDKRGLDADSREAEKGEDDEDIVES